MITPRWQLPDSPLRADVLAAEGAGLTLVVVSASAIRGGLHLTVAYPVAAGVLFLGVSLAAIGFLAIAHPYDRFGPANQVTLLRAVVTALVGSLVFQPPTEASALVAVGASLLVAALDGVDGWLARRERMTSAFGARFDMEVDALLILSLSALAYVHGKAGAWVLLSGLLRYAFVAAGWLVPWFRRPLPASRRRQAICVAQVIGLVLVMVPAVAWPASAFVGAAALALLAFSFLVDTLWLWRHAP